MEQIILETLQMLTNEKIKKRVSPIHINLVDFRKELGSQITETILKLINDGKIEVGQTLNDRYLKPITKNYTTNEKANKNIES